jgi:hypothetical protein
MPSVARGDLQAAARRALLKAFTGETDPRGYTRTSEENLLPGIDFSAIEPDLRRGDGHELESKFRAVHSSSALAVNSFGRFKRAPRELVFASKRGANDVEFEKPLRIFRGGRAPNLDVWIRRDQHIFAVESKCLEYLKRKVPLFSPAYERLAPPTSEERWWRVYEHAKLGAPQYLDRAQLIKHYFGISAFRRRIPTSTVTLIYLFWEPLNWQEIDACLAHREELAAFASALGDTQVQFSSMSYNDLWDSWLKEPELVEHAKQLRARYQVHA